MLVHYLAEATIEFSTHGLNGTLDFGEADVEGWLACRVRMRAPGFEADYACNVQRSELELLRVQVPNSNYSAMSWRV